jgi:hypothetical protein
LGFVGTKINLIGDKAIRAEKEDCDWDWTKPPVAWSFIVSNRLGID